MKKILWFFIMFLPVCLAGCLPALVCPNADADIGWYDISNFTVPDDPGFIFTIKSLSEPWLIAAYMKTNFTYKLSRLAKSPYCLFLCRFGDCNDFSAFGVFVANYNNIPAWQVRIVFGDRSIAHWLAVYWEERIGLYSYTSNQDFSYYVLKDIGAVVENYCWRYNREWISYEVYDNKMNVVERHAK